MEYSKESLLRSDRSFSRSDFIFFWGHTDRKAETGKACLSQWYPSPFVVDDGYYHCAEQYMMAQKARLFGDSETFIQIMASYDPMTIKKLGRRVCNFSDSVWRCNRIKVVLDANLAKFSQNVKLLEFMLSTGDKILVEASPYDTIWGIGMTEDDPAVCDPRQWKGENLLGFALMKVRDILKKGGTENIENI